MLLEGDLIEVSIDEVQEVWSMLQEDAELQVAFEKAGPDKVEEEDGKRPTRKRKEVSPSNSVISSSGSTSGSIAEGLGSKNRKRKRVGQSITPKSSPSPAPSSASSHGMWVWSVTVYRLFTIN